MLTIFDRLVFHIVSQIPPGKVTTYGEIAKALGDVRAARAVGASLPKNPRPVEIPCHRVVMSDGSLGGYAFGGPERKRELLLAEGVPFKGDRVDLSKALVTHEYFDVLPILSRMREAQQRLADLLVSEEHIAEDFEVAVGVDVSFWKDLAVAAAVTVDRKGNVLDVNTVRGHPLFPYVPTYLAFREFPLVARALRNLDYDVLFADGQGVLHPRRMGEAAHFGVVLDVPSVGVAKSHLVGELSGDRVLLGGEHLGYLVRGAYVSPGQYMDVEGARSVALAFWPPNMKQPLPLRLAHRYSLSEMRRWREELLD